MDNRPIGVFDSGLGGLTVLRELRKRCPNENYVYFGDCGRIPYGSKSEETVKAYTMQDIRLLLTSEVKAIVIACNTASSYGFSLAAETFDLPIFEVVSPGARAALRQTSTGRIGVIGTSGTISSKIYERTIFRETCNETVKKELLFDAETQVRVFSQACPLFVPLAEEGWWNDDVTAAVCQRYLSVLKDEDIDVLVLGCTHYPLLAKAIEGYLGVDVRLITSGEVLSAELSDYLKVNHMEAARVNKGICQYFTSDSVEKFKQLGEMFLNDGIDNIRKVQIDQY